MTLEFELESWLEAETGADGLLNAREDSLGRAAALFRAGSLRNMTGERSGGVCTSSGVVQTSRKGESLSVTELAA